MDLPPCGLYRTTQPIGTVPEGRLVFFHNHGDPGPGIYLPHQWTHNRCEFEKKGVTLPDPALALTLAPLPPQGFYRVVEPFWCCADRHRQFQRDELVQLGYNADAVPILFVPELVGGQLAIPEIGTRIDPARFEQLRRLRVREVRPGTSH